MALAQNYITVSRRPPDVEDYIDMMRRYRSWIIGPMFAGLVVATVVAFFWPDTYVSTATLRITPPATTLIQADFGTQMSQRLNDMQNEILSRTTLEDIIRKPALDLYKRDQSVKPMEDVVAKMRKDINVRLSGSPMINGDGRTVASAFTIEFRYPERLKAERVVEELVSRFMESNQRIIHTHESSNRSLIDDILKSDKDALDAIELRISTFTAANQGKLPEDFGSNQQMLTNLMAQASQYTQQIAADREQIGSLNASLRSAMSMKEFQEQHVEDTITREPQTAAQQVQNQSLIAVIAQLNQLDAQIAAQRNTLGENNPQMRELRSTRGVLQAKKDELEQEQEKKAAAAPAAGPSGPTTIRVQNPNVAAAMVNLDGQIGQLHASITAKDQDITRIGGMLEDANRKLAAYSARIDAGPRSGQEYAQLTRERQRLQDAYDADQKKRGQNEQATAAEEHKVGENLDELDRPSLPEQPVEPKRPLYAAVGTAIGLMIGIMLAGAKEVKNTSLKNLKDVRAYTNMPVLSSIPLLENALLVRRKRRLYLLAWSCSLILGFLAMGASMYYYYSQSQSH